MWPYLKYKTTLMELELDGRVLVGWATAEHWGNQGLKLRERSYPRTSREKTVRGLGQPRKAHRRSSNLPKSRRQPLGERP